MVMCFCALRFRPDRKRRTVGRAEDFKRQQKSRGFRFMETPGPKAKEVVFRVWAGIGRIGWEAASVPKIVVLQALWCELGKVANDGLAGRDRSYAAHSSVIDRQERQRILVAPARA